MGLGYITVLALAWGVFVIIMYKVGVEDGKNIMRLKNRVIEKTGETRAVVEQERISAILHNIDNYDGSGIGQKEVL